MVRRMRQRLLGSLRGSGELRAAGRTFSISYELDRFQDSGGQRANGSISGDVHELLASGDGSAATLVLEDGSEIPVLVSDAGSDGADVEATGSTLWK